MKKLLYLITLSLVVTLMATPAALAQGSPYCPGGGFPASDPDDPGEASLECFDTQEEANYYGETGKLLPEETPDTPMATGGQYETPTAPEVPDETATPAPPTETALPDTGGPALLLPAAGLLLSAGLVGLAIVRRRS